MKIYLPLISKGGSNWHLFSTGNWYRQWLSTEYVPSHYLNHWWPRSLLYTVECRYDKVRFITIVFMALRWQQQNLNQTSNSQQTHHASPSRASYGCLLWGFWRKLTALSRHRTVYALIGIRVMCLRLTSRDFEKTPSQNKDGLSRYEISRCCRVPFITLTSYDLNTQAPDAMCYLHMLFNRPRPSLPSFWWISQPSPHLHPKPKPCCKRQIILIFVGI